MCLSAFFDLFRKYGEKKLSENLESEIMQVILDEARDAYGYSRVIEISSATVDQQDEAIEKIKKWIDKYIHSNDDTGTVHNNNKNHNNHNNEL